MPSTRKRQYRLQKLNWRIGLGWLNKWKKQNSPIQLKNNLKTIAGGVRDCTLVFLSSQPTHWFSPEHSCAQTAEKIVTLRASHMGKLVLAKFIKLCKSQMKLNHHANKISLKLLYCHLSFFSSSNKFLESWLKMDNNAYRKSCSWFSFSVSLILSLLLNS